MVDLLRTGREIIRRAYVAVLMIGSVTHELSHALAIVLMPNIKLDAISPVDVTYHGKETPLKVFIIAYTPLVVNVSLAYGILQRISIVSISPTISTAVMIIGMFVSFSMLLSSIPSYLDVSSPLKTTSKIMNQNILSIHVVIGIFIAFISVPLLLVSYVFRRFLMIQILVNLVYATVLTAIFLEVVTVGDLMPVIAIVVAVY